MIAKKFNTPDYGTHANAAKFNNPFLLHSDRSIPTDFYNALELALFLAIKNPIYTQAATRTVSHFITDLAFVGESGDQREKKDLREYLLDDLKILGHLQQAGLEERIYGNSFWRIHYPFTRYLVDKRDGKYKQIALSAYGEDIHFNLDTMTYNVRDPRDTSVRIDLPFIDRKSLNPAKIKLRPLDPLRMSVNMNWISGTCEYVYRFEEFFRSAVRNGTQLHQINETPIDMLMAIKNNQDFVFNADAIYHLRQPFISGISQNGWGIPNILLNYTSLHQMQVLRCINEAIGLDYMTPFRLISPAPTASQAGNDMATSTNMGVWTAAMSQLIEQKRRNPTLLHTVPFPVSYQELGGNGKALAPVELMKFQQDELLSGMGYPAELWSMSLQTQQIPTAVRMFESTFTHLQRNLSGMCSWVVKNILNYLEKEQIGVRLMPPSIADDMEKRHVWLQLAAGGELSRATAYRALNIDDPIAEGRRRAQEDIELQKMKQQENAKFEREMTLGSANQIVEAMVQSQGGPGGVAPGGGGAPGAPVQGPGGQLTPLDIEQQAEEIAMQMLQIQDVGARRKELMQIKNTNPHLYAVVQRKMEDMRQEGASQGRKSVGQQ